jgi:hypothetical protein
MATLHLPADVSGLYDAAAVELRPLVEPAAGVVRALVAGFGPLTQRGPMRRPMPRPGDDDPTCLRDRFDGEWADDLDLGREHRVILERAHARWRA